MRDTYLTTDIPPAWGSRSKMGYISIMNKNICLQSNNKQYQISQMRIQVIICSILMQQNYIHNKNVFVDRLRV